MLVISYSGRPRAGFEKPGRICYGVNYVLWNPVAEIHQRFPPGTLGREVTRFLFLQPINYEENHP